MHMSFRRATSLINDLPGPVFVAIYILCNSAIAVYSSYLFTAQDPIYLVLCVFGLAQIIYVVTLKNRLATLVRIRDAWMYVLFSNIATAANWLFFMYAISYFKASFVSSMMIAIVPIYTLILSPRLRPGVKIVGAEYFLVLGCSLFVLAESFLLTSPKPNMPSTYMITGFMFIFVCSLGISLNSFIAKHLNERGFTPHEIMASRFTLLIMISVYLVYDKGVSGLNSYPLLTATIFTLIIGVLIGTYSLQLGIKKSEPLTISFIMYTAPILTACMELLDKRIPFSIIWFLYVSCLSAYLAFMAVLVFRAKAHLTTSK